MYICLFVFLLDCLFIPFYFRRTDCDTTMNSGRGEVNMLDYLNFGAKITLKGKNKTDFFLIMKDANALSPIKCSTLQTTGAVLVLLFVANIVTNTALLYMFKTYKHLKNNMSTFVISLTVLNLIGTTFTLPFVIASNFMCKYRSKEFRTN